jgi:hypothetical protein
MIHAIDVSGIIREYICSATAGILYLYMYD